MTAALRQYQRQSVLDASPDVLIDKLYGLGVSAARSGDAGTARRVLVELLAALDAERGGEIAGRLHDLYVFALDACASGDLASVGDLLGGLREAWREGVLARRAAPALAA